MAKGYYYIQTFGCQMNEHDSEIIAGLLSQEGYEKTEDRDGADIILLNTCCIREKAEHKVMSLLGELRNLAEKDPSKVIGVCGCMVQQQDIVPKILHACPHVNLLMGTNSLHNTAQYINYIRTTGERVCDIPSEELVIEKALPSERMHSFKAFVNITFGCNNYCTYCIVPYVRGRERSRSMGNILEEVRQLAHDGVKEITFLGQNVNSYGNDLPDDEDTFPKLLAEADKINGIERIRFMTSHPKDLSDELINVIRSSEHICHYIHLPVQAGSNDILRRMNRRYTREHYLDLVSRIRTAIPNVALTTDIIVGFPGETEYDFQQTLDLVNEVGFDGAFSFIYSPRPGTAAATFSDDTSLEEKKERLSRLNKALSYWSLKRNQVYEQKMVKVLVDGVSKTNSDVLSAKTDTGKLVHFSGDSSLVGTFVDIHIDEAQTWLLKGTYIKK